MAPPCALLLHHHRPLRLVAPRRNEPIHRPRNRPPILPQPLLRPATGQFLTRDPADAMTRSAYGYVGNDPLNASDPLGLCSWTSWSCDKQSVVNVAGGTLNTITLGHAKGVLNAAGDAVGKKNNADSVNWDSKGATGAHDAVGVGLGVAAMFTGVGALAEGASLAGLGYGVAQPDSQQPVSKIAGQLHPPTLDSTPTRTEAHTSARSDCPRTRHCSIRDERRHIGITNEDVSLDYPHRGGRGGHGSTEGRRRVRERPRRWPRRPRWRRARTARPRWRLGRRLVQRR